MAGKQWTTNEMRILKANIDKSIAYLHELIPDRTQLSIKLKQTSILKKDNDNGFDVKETPIGGDNIRDNKFNPKKHKILNSSTVGKIPVWIESERLTVYTSDESRIPHIKEKYENRHKVYK